jgi:ATP-dependent Clp protease protease subunit
LLLADRTGQDICKVSFDTERDYSMTASAAKKYGIIDDIIGGHCYLED